MFSSNICISLANTAPTSQHQWLGPAPVSASFPCLPTWFSCVELGLLTLQLNWTFPSTCYSRPYKLPKRLFLSIVFPLREEYSSENHRVSQQERVVKELLRIEQKKTYTHGLPWSVQFPLEVLTLVV